MTICKVNCFSPISMGIFLAGMIIASSVSAAETISIGSLDLSKVRQDWGQAQMDKSVDGHTLTIGGKKFEHGMGTHATSTLYIDLKGNAER
jgi:alpha-galactosidase